MWRKLTALCSMGCLVLVLGCAHSTMYMDQIQTGMSEEEFLETVPKETVHVVSQERVQKAFYQVCVLLRTPADSIDGDLTVYTRRFVDGRYVFVFRDRNLIMSGELSELVLELKENPDGFRQLLARNDSQEDR